MRDPLAEPRTTPVSLRMQNRESQDRPFTVGPETVNHAAACRTITVHHRLADAAESLLAATVAELAAMASGNTTVAPCRDCNPPTVRDLIRAARAAGLKRRRQAPGVWVYAMPDAPHRTYVDIQHLVRDRWRITVYSRDYGSNVMLLGPTAADIADAARLCGWNVDRGVS